MVGCRKERFNLVKDYNFSLSIKKPKDNLHPLFLGDGLEWDTIYGCDIKWNEFFKKHTRLDPIKIA